MYVVLSSDTIMPASSSSRKNVQPSKANESAEDFVEVEPKGKPRPRQRGGDSAAVRNKKQQPPRSTSGLDVAPSSDVFDGLPDCPICGKKFSRSQPQQRTSHLKSCGASRGLSAGQLVKVRQLEERQAEERKALGLPAVPPKMSPGGGAVANGTKAKAERESSRHAAAAAAAKSRKTPTSACSDPGLEMALALSASLAQSKAKAEEEAQKKECEILGMASSGEGPSTCQENARPPEVILPSAAAWPIKMPASGVDPRPKRGSKNTKAKTQLQVRTEEERNRVISERAAVVLTSDEFRGEVGGAHSLTKRHPAKESLQGAFRGNCRLWDVASAQVGDFIVDIMEPYANSKSCPEVAANSDPKRAGERPPDCNEGRGSGVGDDVGPSWLSLLRSGEKSDVVVFCKGEREIRCHSLVLLARCRAVLRDVIAAKNPEGEDESMIAWNDSRPEAVGAFLEYLYSGRVGAIASKPALNDLRALAKRYSVDSAVDSQLGGRDRDVLLSDSGSESESGDATDAAVMKNGFTQPAVSDDGEEGDTERPENLDYLLSAFSDGVSQEREGEEEEEEERNVTVEEPGRYEDAGCGIETDEDLFGCENNSETEPIVIASERSVTGEHLDKLSLVLESEEMHKLSPVKSRYGNFGSHDNERESDIGDLPSIPGSDVGRAEMSAGPENEFDIWDGFDPQGGDMFVGGGEEDCAAPAALMNKTPSPLPGPSRATTPPTSSRTQKAAAAAAAAAASTPKHSSRHRLAYSQSDAVTPKPDFAGMLSPALRKELDKFGLKVIPRRKAIPLLEHIYEETHPIVVEEGEREREGGEEERSQDNSEGSDFSSDGEDFPEESMLHKYGDEDHGEGDAAAAAPLAIQPTQTERTLSEMVKEFIRGDPSLHKQVLLYEPIWFESFVADFKEKTGLGRKCKGAEVADVLDAECVTFRTSASSARRRRKSPKKKSPKKAKRKAAAAATATSAGQMSPKRRRGDQARACHN